MPGKSGPGSDGNEGVFCIPQGPSITGTSSLDWLVSYPGHSLGGGSYPSAEVQSVYSTAPTDWAIKHLDMPKKILFSRRTKSCIKRFLNIKTFRVLMYNYK